MHQLSREIHTLSQTGECDAVGVKFAVGAVKLKLCCKRISCMTAYLTISHLISFMYITLRFWLFIENKEIPMPYVLRVSAAPGSPQTTTWISWLNIYWHWLICTHIFPRKITIAHYLMLTINFKNWLMSDLHRAVRINRASTESNETNREIDLQERIESN